MTDLLQEDQIVDNEYLNFWIMTNKFYLQAPRVKALTIFGSTLLFSNIYNSLPVIKSDSLAPLLETKQNLRVTFRRLFLIFMIAVNDVRTKNVSILEKLLTTSLPY